MYGCAHKLLAHPESCSASPCLLRPTTSALLHWRCLDSRSTGRTNTHLLPDMAPGSVTQALNSTSASAQFRCRPRCSPTKMSNTYFTFPRDVKQVSIKSLTSAECRSRWCTSLQVDNGGHRSSVLSMTQSCQRRTLVCCGLPARSSGVPSTQTPSVQ
jgi:hypothetical protein